MRKLRYFLWMMLIVWQACHVGQKTTNDSMPTSGGEIQPSYDGTPVLVFDNPLHDFGTVMKGEKRAHTFTFSNQGDGELLIEIVSACTCTTVDWPRLAIPPGGKGELPIIFDSSEKDGETLIDIDVIANTEPVLTSAQFRADVVSEKK